MLDENPPQPPPLPLTRQQRNNVVTDTVLGPNLRRKDNLYQGLFIAGSTVLGAGIGWLTTQDKLAGLIFGAFLGTVVGLFASGIFLMIYRWRRHSRGEHD